MSIILKATAEKCFLVEKEGFLSEWFVWLGEWDT